MVAAVDFAVDAGGAKGGQETVGDDEIVDAPTCVLLAGVEAVAPP